MDRNRSFCTVFSVDQSPEKVFAAINDVGAWWTAEPGIEGKATKVGDEFTYRYGDVHDSRQKVTELVPGKKVVWQVLDARLDFTKNKAEWKGTQIVFDLEKKGDKTEVRFTHVGLVPEFECFDACSNGWSTYVNGSLQAYLMSGKRQPSPTW